MNECPSMELILRGNEWAHVHLSFRNHMAWDYNRSASVAKDGVTPALWDGMLQISSPTDCLTIHPFLPLGTWEHS